MPKKALASLNVVINAVTSPLFRGLAKASKRLTVFGAKMRTVGRSISMSFALPFAAIGVAGAKMAIDFEKNMTKINTLVGISGKEVKKLSAEVMKLSGKTAQAPAELAEGLFFLSSAGLRGANALTTLEAVSKGTAIGLGEQADLAKVAAAAQNAYGEDTLSAAQALDIFGGSVRAGMFEASDLAEVLGTQLGLASSLGISFEETNAFIATYTKTTGDARSATTSFGGVMMALAKTTPKMEKALNKVGMSGDSVRKMLGEQGLKATLENIKTSFEDNNVPLTEFFSKSQALKGVLGVLGNQTETYGKILDDLGNSTGLVDEGFETLEQNAGFKMKKAFNSLKLSVQDLGTIMMPVFTKIVNGAKSLASAFTELDGSTKKIILASATLVAFSGPLMALAGGLVSALGAILSPVGLVVVALGALFYVIYDNWGTVKGLLVQLVNYFITLYNESTLFRGAIQYLVFTLKTVLAFAVFWGKSVVDIFIALKNSAMKILGGIGDIILGIFTLDAGRIKEGFDKALSPVKDTIADAFDGIAENAKEFGDKTAENFKKGVEATLNNRPLELITEDDIDKTVTNVGNWFTDKLGKVKEKLKGMFSGGGGINLAPGGGEDFSGWQSGGSNSDAGGDPKKLSGNLDKQMGVWETYWSDVTSGSETLVGKISAGWNQISGVASSVLNGIGDLWAAENEKAMTIMENEQTVAQENFDADYERELLALENSILTQEERGIAETDLKIKYDGKQQTIDETFEDKKNDLRIKAARQDKNMKYASALMAGANAVTNALASGIPPPGNIILAGVVGGLAAAQIAAIASTPIPMATGGLAYGPVNAIVGDNPGAANDPEVVAPLSKLKSILSNEMNVSLNVSGIVKGNDIYLSNDKTTEQRPRYI